MFLLLIAGGLLAAGCGASEPGSASGGASSSEPSSEATSGSTSTPPLASGVPSPSASVQPPPPGGDPSAAANVPPNLLSQILDDAARQAGVSVNEVRVTSVLEKTWSDGSLGCPEPGMNYIQILVDGFQIFVQAGGRTLDYRTSDRGSFKLCQQGPTK